MTRPTLERAREPTLCFKGNTSWHKFGKDSELCTRSHVVGAHLAPFTHGPPKQPPARTAPSWVIDTISVKSRGLRPYPGEPSAASCSRGRRTGLPGSQGNGEGLGQEVPLQVAARKGLTSVGPQLSLSAQVKSEGAGEEDTDACPSRKSDFTANRVRGHSARGAHL